VKTLFNFLPPSVNHLYKTTGHGKFSRRVMTNEGKAAKNAMQIHVGRALGLRVPGTEWVDEECELQLDAVFFFPRLYTVSRGAKSKFVKVDTENYTKLIHDVVATVSGWDDSANFDIRLRKREYPVPGLYLHVQKQVPVDEPFLLKIEQLLKKGEPCVQVREGMSGPISSEEHEAPSGANGLEPDGVQLALELGGSATS